MSKTEPKVAIVHDWLVAYAGADRVVDCMHHVFPNAVIYTLVYDEKKMPAWFKDYDIRTTWVQRIPFATRIYKNLLPLMPGAFEALDLSEYDLVLSSSSSCAKGVITRPDAVHICYCHTPTRYVWDFYYTYRDNANWLVKAVMPHQIHKMRVWDKCAADRVDYFIANSHYIAQRIKKYYRRDSDVIYPCCHINEAPFVKKEDFYLVVGRLTWYKRVDLAVAACTKLGKRLVVIGGGACETVLPGKTGYWFHEQTPDSLMRCIEVFERDGVAYTKEEIREHSRSFSEARFEKELGEYCARRMADWQQELLGCSHWQKEEMD